MHIKIVESLQQLSSTTAESIQLLEQHLVQAFKNLEPEPKLKFYQELLDVHNKNLLSSRRMITELQGTQ